MGRKKILADFKKKTHKVGKKVNPTNQTKIKVKTKKIWLPNQGIKSAEDGDSNEKEELLSSIKHLKGQSDHGRINALQRISAIFLAPEASSLALETVPLIFPAIMELLFDDEKDIREQVVSTVTSLLTVLPTSVVGSVAQLFSSTIRSALNHFNKTVRKDAMVLCCEALTTHPDVMSNHSQKLFESIVPILQDKSLVYTFAAKSSSEETKSVSFSNISIEKTTEKGHASTTPANTASETITSKVKTEESDRQHGQQAKSTLFQFALKALYLLLNMQQQQPSEPKVSSNSSSIESSPNGLLLLDSSLCMPLQRLSAFVNAKVLSSSSSLLTASYKPLNQSQGSYSSVDEGGPSIAKIGKVLQNRLLSVWIDLTHSYDPHSMSVSNSGSHNPSLPHDTLALLADCLTHLVTSLSSNIDIVSTLDDAFHYDINKDDTMLQTICRYFPFGVATLDMAVSRFVASVSRHREETQQMSTTMLMYRERVVIHLVQAHCGFSHINASNTVKKRSLDSRIENKRKMKRSSLSLLVIDPNTNNEEDGSNSDNEKNTTIVEKEAKPVLREKKVKKKIAGGKKGNRESLDHLVCLSLLLQLNNNSDGDIVNSQLKELRMSVLCSFLTYIHEKNTKSVINNSSNNNDEVDVQERCLALHLLKDAEEACVSVLGMSVGDALRILLHPLLSSTVSKNLHLCYVSGKYSDTALSVMRHILLLSGQKATISDEDRDRIVTDVLLCLFSLLETYMFEEEIPEKTTHQQDTSPNKRKTIFASKQAVLLFVQRLYSELLPLLPVASLLKVCDTPITSDVSLLKLSVSQRYMGLCDLLLLSLVTSLRVTSVKDIATVVSVGKTVTNALLSVASLNADFSFVEHIANNMISFVLSVSAMTSLGDNDSLCEILRHVLRCVQLSSPSMARLQVIVSRHVLSTVEHLLYSDNFFNNSLQNTADFLYDEERTRDYYSVAEECKVILTRSLSALLFTASLNNKDIVETVHNNELIEVTKALLGAHISLSGSFPIILRNVLTTLFVGEAVEDKLMVLRELTVTIAQQMQQSSSVTNSVYRSNVVKLIKDVTESFLNDSEEKFTSNKVKEYVFDVKNALEHVAALYAN